MHAESGGCIGVAADNCDRARAHMLFFAHNLGHALVQEVGEHLCRMFQQIWFQGSFTGRHRGRQIDQPLWIDRKSAHHFHRGNGILFANRHRVVQPSRDDSLTEHIVNVQ